MSSAVEVNEELLQQIVQIIVKECEPERVILFGSRASQTHKPDSDVDLLVISQKPFDKNWNRLREMARLERALGRIKAPTDILLFSSEEVKRKRTAPNQLVYRAFQEGRILYV